jgi:hypothetical protein
MHEHVSNWCPNLPQKIVQRGWQRKIHIAIEFGKIRRTKQKREYPRDTYQQIYRYIDSQQFVEH